MENGASIFCSALDHQKVRAGPKAGHPAAQGLGPGGAWGLPASRRRTGLLLLCL